jgi:hypothetical protein
MTSLVTKLLGPPEKVEPFPSLPTYLHRWMIFATQHFKIYLHHSFHDDLTDDLCNYPERFVSFGVVDSNGGDSAGIQKAFPGKAAWMVSIARSSGSEEKSPRD